MVGGGPGGYTCALRLAQLGAKVAVVEQNKLGGVCVNSGCIPVKAFHASAKIVNDIRTASKHGISCGEVKIDYPVLRKRAMDIAKMNEKGIAMLLKKSGIDLITGYGKIISSGSVQVGNETINAENIVIATGSAPIQILGAPYGDKILSSETLLDVEDLPKSLLIVGGGYVGVEYACIFRALGSKVTIVEMMDRLLLGFDPEIVAILQRNMTRMGVDISFGVKVEKVSDTGVIVSGSDVQADKVLVAVGRRPSFNKPELDAIGVKYEKGIQTDEHMQTTVPGIFAIGDCVGKFMLAHVASHEGMTVAENIMGGKAKMDYSCVPGCVFSFPEIAFVGSSDSTLTMGKFPFIANGKARTLGETDGIVKVYVKNGIIVGTSIIGPHASDLINEATLAIRNGMKIEDITNTIHPHPVLSEAFVEACLDSAGKSINK